MSNYYQLTSVFDHTVLKEHAHSVTNWHESHGFQVVKVPPYIVDTLPIAPVLIKFNALAVILKMDPMTWYDWHIDARRVCTINSLLDGSNSKCFYGNRLSRDIVELDELVYTPGEFCLLDTTKEHAVLNLENTRYVLSIGMAAPYSFDEVKNFCVDNSI